MMLQKTINHTKSNPKQLFLLDGFGALVSAFFLGYILVRFESEFGMPKKELYYLAFAACLFAIYDFICYFKIKENWRPFLKTIAIVNLIYCIISIGLIIYHFQKLTTLGLVYFILEILILVIIIKIELQTATHSTN